MAVYLAIVYMTAMTTYWPYLEASMPDLETCEIAAEKLNRDRADMLKKLEDGAEYVCLQVRRTGSI